MRLTIVICLFFYFYSFAQSELLIEYTSSLRAPDYLDDLILSNNLSIGLKKNKVIYSVGLGREDWYLKYFNSNYSTNHSIYNAHCRTYKISGLIEYQFYLIKSKLSLNMGLGIKTYFLNELTDSLSRGVHGNLSARRPPYLQDAKEKNIDKLNGVDLDDLAFITSVPYALTANIALQYTFKKWGLKLYYQPYFMKIKYETVKSSTKGSNFVFYNNLGLGITYHLNFKKKDQKVTGIE
jgi:hypothetical protein